VKRTAVIALSIICTAALSLRGDEPKKPGPASNAAPALIRSAQSGPWSSPDTWEGKKVPDASARVQVRAGHTVTYDIASDRVIRSIHVAGTLTFARDRDTRLDVGLIKIQAGDNASEDGFNCDAHLNAPDPGKDRPALEVGTANDPIPAGHTAMIRLAAVDGLDKETCPAIVCCGGRMDLHGAPLSRTWVKLGATVSADRAGKGIPIGPGETEIKLADAVTGWRAGDRILVTTTTSRSRVNQRQTLRQGPGIAPAYTEVRTIKAINGDRLTVDRPLDYFHQGEGDYRGEVANLSRNVIIESADPLTLPSPPDKGGEGRVRGSRGHTMYHKHSTGAISYAEFRHLGKEGLLGKYPIHVHLAGETMRGSYVLGTSVWDSGNRWVTVHGTNYFIVRDCVGYQSVGHGFFLEDGSEVFNVFDRNLAVQAFAGKPLPEQFLPFDHNDGAGFWWANSQNTFTRNVAVECDRYGFRFEASPIKGFDLRRPILRPDGSIESVDIRTLSFIRFDGNEAHDQLFGVNLGGKPADFFAAGVDGVVPGNGDPFLVQNTKIWNTHWAFAPHTRYAITNLDIADSTYGLFLPAYDTEVVPPLGRERREATPDWGRMTFRRTQVPVRLPDAKSGYFGDPFDLMEFARDILPPTTIITHVQRTKNGALRVRGTTAENTYVKAVLVNGRPAKATAENFAEWELTLDGLGDGEVTLSAHAVDDFGNVEPRPHRLVVRTAGDSAVSLLNLPAEEKRPDAVVGEKQKQPKTQKSGSDSEVIQGTWRMISQQRDGRATARPTNMKWIIDDETIWLVIDREGDGAAASKKPTAKSEAPAGKSAKPSGPQRGLPMAYRLSAAGAPKHIDIDGPRKGNSFGVYKLDGDELTLCMGVTQASPSYDKRARNDENTRPAAISPEAGTVIVLRRIKD
jgi:uncharacterized protein (TIGR03067 family)